MKPKPFHPSAPPSRRGFVLLEVIVSLAILGIALSMVMKSLTISLRAAQRSQRVTMATILARDLIEKWELKPPPTGTSREDFGKEFPGLSFEVTYNLEELDYDDVSELDEGRPAYMRRVSLRIVHTPKNPNLQARTVLQVETGLSASERYSDQSRVQNEISFDI